MTQRRHLRIVGERAAAGADPADAVRAAPVPAAWRVLVVEDNEHLDAIYRAALRRVAAAHGVSEVVERVRDGAGALARLAARPRVDLVVTDLYMPGVDGFTLLARMRADPSHVMTPAVAISAGGEEARQRALEAGADAFLRKPFRMAALVETVRQALRR